METNLPTPMAARVYVNLLEGRSDSGVIHLWVHQFRAGAEKKHCKVWLVSGNLRNISERTSNFQQAHHGGRGCQITLLDAL